MPPLRTSAFRFLLAASAGVHAADQLAFAALPLVAVIALGAGPGTIGVLVAMQGAAWLLLSLPGGVLVDRLPQRGLLVAACLASGTGCACALLVALAGLGAGALGAAALLTGCGTVLFMLGLGPAVPALVERTHLPVANARLEAARALVTLLAPPLAGWLATLGAAPSAYAFAAAAASLAAIAAWRLPPPAVGRASAMAAPRPTLRSAVGAMRDGAAFVLREPLLRGVALCAGFWNFGFFVLLGAFVPFALGTLGFTPGAMGLAQSGYGVGLLLGAATAPATLRRFGPNLVLLGGPALSVLAPGCLLVAIAFTGQPAVATCLVFLAQALLGFGPMQWLICQTTLRQAVTPPGLLGRVGGTIQMAIYGVRALGALVGGGVAEGSLGPTGSVLVAGAAFAASLAVVGASPLAHLRAFPAAAARA